MLFVFQESSLLSTEILAIRNSAKLWPNRIYLATYPRSGNHWTRYLIEEATHIASSSVFCDPEPQHLSTPFVWGGYCAKNGCIGTCRYPTFHEGAVIKTHFPVNDPTPFDTLPYIRTIRIVRHPLDSIYSFYVLMQKFHNLPVEHYIPRSNLQVFVEKWKQFQEHWDQAENVVTIYYEELYNNPEINLKLILDATGYDYTEKDLQRAIKKFPPTGGLYKHFDHFTDEDIKLVHEQLNELMEKHGYY